MWLGVIFQMNSVVGVPKDQEASRDANCYSDHTFWIVIYIQISWDLLLPADSAVQVCGGLRVCISPKFQGQGHQNNFISKEKLFCGAGLMGRPWRKDHITSELIIAKKGNGHQGHTQPSTSEKNQLLSLTPRATERWGQL